MLEWVLSKRPTALGIISGAIAGLATVTPASGYVTPAGAIAIGFLTGIVCYFAVVWVKNKFGYDDSLDAFGVHGVGGMLGVLMIGILATTAINPAGADGLAYGNPRQLLRAVPGDDHLRRVLVRAVLRVAQADRQDDGPTGHRPITRTSAST